MPDKMTFDGVTGAGILEDRGSVDGQLMDAPIRTAGSCGCAHGNDSGGCGCGSGKACSCGGSCGRKGSGGGGDPGEPPAKVKWQRGSSWKCCFTCGRATAFEMRWICGYDVGNNKIFDIDGSLQEVECGRTCNPIPVDPVGRCDPLHSDGSGGYEPFDPVHECCEGGVVKSKVSVYVVSRDGGGTEGKWAGRNALGRLGGHMDLLLPIPADDWMEYGRIQLQAGLDAREPMATAFFDEKPVYEMVGYFGSDGTCSGSATGSYTDHTGSVGMGLDGRLLRSYNDWAGKDGRPDSTRGKAGGVRSSICRIWVCPAQAMKMRFKAEEIWRNPKKFYILGNNCSGNAASILSASGIEVNMYPVDTPGNVFATIFRTFPIRSLYCGPGYTVYDDKGARIEWEDMSTQGNRDDWAALTPNANDYDSSDEWYYPHGY